MSNEDKANSVHDQATADGADFDKIAKENTIAKKTEYTFDSADTKLPTDVMDAAFKTKMKGSSFRCYQSNEFFNIFIHILHR